MNSFLYWTCYVLAVLSGGVMVLALLDQTDTGVWGTFLYFTAMFAIFAYLLRKKENKNKLIKKQESSTSLGVTTQNKRKRRSIAPAEEKGLKLLFAAILEDDKVSQDEAEAVRAMLGHLRSNNRRLRKILHVATEALSDHVLDEAEAEELRVLISEYLDSLQKFTPPKKTNLKSQSTKPIVDVSTAFAELETRKEYHISYTDSVGNESEREIFVSSIKTNKAGNTIVYARCKQANASRSFRLDRINEAIDSETGELVIL